MLCETCNGTGQVYDPFCGDLSLHKNHPICNACDGKNDCNMTYCRKCDGSGEIENEPYDDREDHRHDLKD